MCTGTTPTHSNNLVALVQPPAYTCTTGKAALKQTQALLPLAFRVPYVINRATGDKEPLHVMNVIIGTMRHVQG